MKDHKHLLMKIHRRKPIHSHSQPQGSLWDTERAVLDDEIEKLSQEKSALQANLWRFRQQQSGAKLQFEDLERRVHEMEQRQLRMLSYLEQAVRNPTFVEHLVRMAGSSMDFSAINKKRRMPVVDYCQEIVVNSSVNNHSINSNPEFERIFHRDFSNKLNLELSPADSDSNFVYPSARSSNEDGRSPQRKTSEGDVRDAHVGTEVLSLAPETLELSDTGTSFALKKDASLSIQIREVESSRSHYLQHSLSSSSEDDGHISFHLNLTLASSELQLNNGHSSRISQLGPEIGISTELRSSANGKETDLIVVTKNRNIADDNVTISSSHEAPINTQGPAAAQGRVNDVFWEQFLTERPGSSDTEDASSSFRANPYNDQKEGNPGHGISWRKSKGMEQLTL